MKVGLGADLRTLYHFMSAGRRRQLALVAMLMPVTAVAEMAMIASIVPFVALLAAQPDGPENFSLLSNSLDRVERLSPGNPLLGAASLFALATLVTAALRLLLSLMSQRFAFGFGHDLSVEIQRRLLHQSYLFHLRHHSSELLASLGKVDHLVYDLVLQGLQAVSAALIALFVLAVLFSLDPLSASLAALLVGGLYALALLAARKRLAAHAKTIGSAYEQRLKAVQESLGGIRDVIIDRSQPLQLERFRAIDERFMRARAETLFLASAPRFLVESLGLIMIALLAVMIAGRSGGLTAALPVLGALALGAQRLLPLMSQLFAGWANLTTSRPIVSELAALVTLPVPSEQVPVAPVAFAEAITFDDVSFHYPDRPVLALYGLSLAIPKGARVAITGRTGSGKSTLADLMMGLIVPHAGQICVDGEALSGERLVGWRQSVAHVPQAIFLADTNIAANIALSDSSPDFERVKHAAQAAQLSGFIDSLPEGYETKVGERGVRLSGGQRQRLGLARAIYKRAPLLVLDEATSALDNETEAAVLAALGELHAEGCTIVIIAHRLSTVAQCDPIFVLEDGALAQSGSYDDLFGSLNRLQQQGAL